MRPEKRIVGIWHRCNSTGEHQLSQILSSFVHLQVADKTEYALHHGLKAIVCIGETLEQRESGELWNVLDSQLKVLGNYAVPVLPSHAHVAR